MKKVELIYSPVCEASMAFAGLLEEWLRNKGVETVKSVFDADCGYQKELYENNGLAANGRMLENCFADVFCGGKLIDSVPLNRNKIYSALGIAGDDVSEAASDESYSSTKNGLSAERLNESVLNGKIIWVPITKETFAEEMTMCLKNYPFGNPPERFHERCAGLKKRVFDEVWEKEACAGVYAKLNDKVIGLIEVFPREILKRHGFLTGTTGSDNEVLTVGCFEVGFGVPRKEMIDFLMLRLETVYCMFSRKKLEGIGVYEWPEGFAPYWVYDKYGFGKKEAITGRKVVMEKTIG